MTGRRGGKAPPAVYDLTAPRTFPAAEAGAPTRSS